MNIYKYLDYNEFIKDFLEARKSSFPKWTQKKLSALADIQSSYLSNALKGKATLSADQLFKIASAMNLDSESKDYIVLLGEHQHCSDHQRKAYLLQKIEDYKKKHLRTESKLGVKPPEEENLFFSTYFSDPYLKVIHVAISIPKYKANPKLLAKDLRISETQLEKALLTLENLGILQLSEKGAMVLKKGFHLPEDHPLVWAHQSLIRQVAITQLSKFNAEKKYSFSATFSCEDKTKDLIKNQILESLKGIQSEVKGAKSEKVYQLNIDLFPWLDE